LESVQQHVDRERSQSKKFKKSIARQYRINETNTSDRIFNQTQ